MKSLLMSCTPQECCNIFNGDCSLLIRKLKPKCKLSIDVYIYCTKNGGYLHLENDGTWSYSKNKKYTYVRIGKVVAKFTLNKVEETKWTETEWYGTETLSWANVL